jgi:hypothetical protein
MTFATSDMHELTRIRLHGGRSMVPVAAYAAAGVARGVGFGDADVDRVHAVVDALTRDVVKAHFDDPNDADFTVVMGKRRGALVVRIEDSGLPYPIDRFSLERDTVAGKLHAAGIVRRS